MSDELLERMNKSPRFKMNKSPRFNKLFSSQIPDSHKTTFTRVISTAI